MAARETPITRPRFLAFLAAMGLISVSASDALADPPRGRSVAPRPSLLAEEASRARRGKAALERAARARQVAMDRAERAAFDKDAKAFAQAAIDRRALASTALRATYLGEARRAHGTETDARAAREAEIQRLEADPQRTPAATLRLAALYREGEGDDTAARAARLGRAIALYERFLDAHPDHPERARVHYLLGVSLREAGRGRDALSVFRALACSDRFPSRAAPSPPRGKRVFVDPYPADCKPLDGAPPELVSTAFRLIGDHHAGEDRDIESAESAYLRAASISSLRDRAAALYRLAGLLAADGRYEAAVARLVELHDRSDRADPVAGAPGTTLLAEADEAIAAALYRLDTPKRARVPIERLQDGTLIPQNRPWTRSIYQALSARYEADGKLHEAIEVDELVLRRWPVHRDAPFVRSRLAGLWDRLAAQAPEGSQLRESRREAAMDQRTKIVESLLDSSPEGPVTADEIFAMERLVRRELRRVAADRTNGARAITDKALSITDKAPRDRALERALGEYRLAAKAWAGYLAQDESAGDAHESRYWLADALHVAVVMEVALARVPSDEVIAAARKAAVVARDAAQEDAFRQSAAFMIVDVAQQALEAQYKLFVETKGARGIERRTGVKILGEGESTHVAKVPLPPPVVAAIAAREEYVARIPPALDIARNLDLYAGQIADWYFFYGHLDEAKQRFLAIARGQCAGDERGRKAWERLFVIVSVSNDIPAARQLAQEHDNNLCKTPSHPPSPDPWRTGCTSCGYVDAHASFSRAQRLPDGPERVKAWKVAGALYREALERAPARDEAPEAAINGAYAFKQVGDYNAATALYDLFIREYGADPILVKLEKGDASSSPPRPPDPKRYRERIGFLKQGYDALAAAQVMFFDYRAAAVTYGIIAANRHFDPGARRDAARNTMLLAANIGDPPRQAAAHTVFLSLSPSAEARADVDYLVAATALRGWDERAPDQGDNRAARLRALAPLDRYLTSYRRRPEATRYLVVAGYNVFSLRRAGRDARAVEACRGVLSAFDRLRASERAMDGRSRAIGSPEADMAAECALVLLDERARADIDARGTRYAGGPDRVMAALKRDMDRTEQLVRELDSIAPRFESHRWSTAAHARAGEILDARREALLLVRARGLAGHHVDALTAPLADLEHRIVRAYAEAVFRAGERRVDSPFVARARARLAILEDTLGLAAMRAACQRIVDPVTMRPFVYRDGMFGRRVVFRGASLAVDPTPPRLPVMP